MKRSWEVMRAAGPIDTHQWVRADAMPGAAEADGAAGHRRGSNACFAPERMAVLAEAAIMPMTPPPPQVFTVAQSLRMPDLPSRIAEPFLIADMLDAIASHLDGADLASFGQTCQAVAKATANSRQFVCLKNRIRHLGLYDRSFFYSAPDYLQEIDDQPLFSAMQRHTLRALLLTSMVSDETVREFVYAKPGTLSPVETPLFNNLLAKFTSCCTPDDPEFFIRFLHLWPKRQRGVGLLSTHAQKLDVSSQFYVVAYFHLYREKDRDLIAAAKQWLEELKQAHGDWETLLGRQVVKICVTNQDYFTFVTTDEFADRIDRLLSLTSKIQFFPVTVLDRGSFRAIKNLSVLLPVYMTADHENFAERIIALAQKFQPRERATFLYRILAPVKIRCEFSIKSGYHQQLDEASTNLPPDDETRLHIVASVVEDLTFTPKTVLALKQELEPLSRELQYQFWSGLNGRSLYMIPPRKARSTVSLVFSLFAEFPEEQHAALLADTLENADFRDVEFAERSLSLHYIVDIHTLCETIGPMTALNRQRVLIGMAAVYRQQPWDGFYEGITRLMLKQINLLPLELRRQPLEAILQAKRAWFAAQSFGNDYQQIKQLARTLPQPERQSIDAVLAGNAEQVMGLVEQIKPDAQEQNQAVNDLLPERASFQACGNCLL